MDTSLGRILYESRALANNRSLGRWDSVSFGMQERWQRIAEEFLENVNAQSSQHFSRLAELLVRDLKATVDDRMVSRELRVLMNRLFDLLPDPDAKVKKQITLLVTQEFKPTMEKEDLSEIVEEIIKTVRDAD